MIEETNENLESTDVENEENQTAAAETKNAVNETTPEAVIEEQTQAETPTEAVSEEPEAAPVAEIVEENNLPTPGDFDWDADEKGFDEYDPAERARLEEIYSGTLNSIESNEIIEATISAISDRDVVLNVGFKSDGLVSIAEFRDLPDLKIGDVVKVLVIEQEDKNGQLLLSRKHAKLLNAWENINTAHIEDTVIEGKVKSRTKGGLVVDVDGVETFLPGSQIDVKPVRDYDQYVGKTMEFKVVKINQTLKNAVVSHKALIMKDIEAQKEEIISKLEKGQVLEGVIKNMTDFGVFIDLGGVDGLLHITDISWGRINHPSDVLELDQKINVVVLDYDEAKKRISLGLKQLQEHPWDKLDAELNVGSRVSGKIVTVTDYGSFLELQPGVEGLIHVSEMSWSQHLRNPQDFHTVGDQIEAVILSIDREDHKMSLGIKQLTPDPWIDIDQKYPLNSRHTGTVRNLTNYGLFVELGEGVDGLVHVSDLSWTKKINHPSEFTKTGEEIEVLVLEIDKENRRLSLGHKQLEDDPWNTFQTIFLEDSVHNGTVISAEDGKGAMVSLPYGLEAYAPKKHLSKEDGGILKTEDVADFRILEFNRDLRKVMVSHTNTWKAEAEREVERAPKAAAKPKSRPAKKSHPVKDAGATLGEFGGMLSGLKQEMEQKEKSAQKKAIKLMDKKVKVQDPDETPKANAEEEE